ncbi:MAG TPA: AAA family ATPase [Acidobacteriota bacterium]|nr:AAA family ATPase [Acidobacteriota bacterium]
MTRSSIVVGLTGPNAAGKGLVADFFVRKGFLYHSLSDAVREEALKRGLTTSREHLIITGRSLREEFGLSILASRTFEKLSGRDIVDSFRHPEEVRFFRENAFAFLLLGVDAPQEMRYERARKRSRGGDSISTFEEFRKKEEEENGQGAGQQLGATFALADIVVVNDGKREDLDARLEPILLELFGGGTGTGEGAADGKMGPEEAP